MGTIEAAQPGLPPGPPPLGRFSVGHARLLGELADDPLRVMHARFERYGDVHAGRVGARVNIHVRHPDHLHQVLVSEASTFGRTGTGLERLLGTGLLTSVPEVWKQRRRAMQPGFRQKQILAFSEAMVAEAQRTSARWTAGAPVDVVAEMHRLTLGILTQTLFSHRIAEPSDRVGEWLTAFQEAVGALDPLPHWVPTPGHLRLRRAHEGLTRLLEEIVAQREAGVEPAPQGDLLDTLVDLVGHGGSTGRSDIRDELLTLFLAGHETTANALSWAWWTLAADERVRTRLLDELDTVLENRAATAADMARLPYLDAFCTELLRRYPPVYVVLREASEATRLGGWDIPAGATIYLWIYETHHDARWYPDPDRFEPERFLRTPLADGPKQTFLPFGAGGHLCIGRHFAELELRLVLATLLRDWRLTGDGSMPRARARFTLRPAPVAPLIAERRAIR